MVHSVSLVLPTELQTITAVGRTRRCWTPFFIALTKSSNFPYPDTLVVNCRKAELHVVLNHRVILAISESLIPAVGTTTIRIIRLTREDGDFTIF
jgi:hypothetical protein